jgi:drug/metabolite transporter (DMT)-like permease
MLGERMTPPLALAATMIVAGIVIAQRRSTTQRSQ